MPKKLTQWIGKLLPNFGRRFAIAWLPRGRSLFAINIVIVNGNKGIIGRDFQNTQVVNAPGTSDNTIVQIQTDQIEDLIESIRFEFDKIKNRIPTEKREEAALHLKNMERAVSEKDQRWYSVSAKGLLEASEFVKDFAGNVLGAISKIGKLIWPEFKFRISDRN